MADLQRLTTIDAPISTLQKANENFSELETRKVDHDGAKGLSTNDYTNDDKSTVSNALIKTAQTLTPAEKAQVRTNIGAGTGNGSVTKVTAGDGMDFAESTSEVVVTLGTPTSIGSGSTNSASGNTHTHAITLSESDIPDLSNKYIKASEKGANSGVATLDENGKVPISQISDVILGQLGNGGTFEPSTATATLSVAGKQRLGATTDTIVLTNDTSNITGYVANNGLYYIANSNGTFAGMSFTVGDWLVSIGTKWDKIDNTDAVASVNGKTGVVVLTASDVGALDKDTVYVASVNGQSGVVTGLAPISNPEFTGTPKAPTANSSDNSTRIATTAFVKGQGYTTNKGTVTSVSVVGGADGGIAAEGGPITESGTITVKHTNELAQAQATRGFYPIAIDKNGHITGYGTAINPLTPDNIIAGDNIAVVREGNNVTISSTATGGGASLSEISWTATDSRWSALTNGIYTLTISSSLIPVGYAKRKDGVNYIDCLASVSYTAGTIYIKSDTKFEGKIAAYSITTE